MKLTSLLKLIFSRHALTALIIIAEAVVTLFFLMHTAAEYKIISYGIRILAIILTLYVINRPHKNEYKIMWLLLILSAPIAGCSVYLVHAIQYAHSSQIENGRYLEKISPDTQKNRFSNQINYLTSCGFPVYRQHTCVYFSDTERYFNSLVEDIKNARRFIFLEFFIVKKSYMWDVLRKLLAEKAKQGVDVRLIYDGMGSISLPWHYYRELNAQGIKCIPHRPFRPLWSTMQNTRDHRKIVVIDGNIGYTGGANIGDEYIGREKPLGVWKDACVKITGGAVSTFTAVFLDMWENIKMSETEFSYFLPMLENVVDSDIVSGDENDGEYISDSNKNASDGNQTAFNNKEEIRIKNSLVQPYCDAPGDGEYVSQNVFLHLINSAKRTLYITTPYLIIDDVVCESLILAAKSGVDVRIITPHIPDKRIVFSVTRSYYPRLIEGGVKIFEYTPGFIHAKMMIADGKNAVIGTANMDFRSLCLHYECGIRLYNCSAIKHMTEDFLSVQSVSTPITRELCDGVFSITKRKQEILRIFAPLM